jgi:hypothetical protein
MHSLSPGSSTAVRARLLHASRPGPTRIVYNPRNCQLDFLEPSISMSASADYNHASLLSQESGIRHGRPSGLYRVQAFGAPTTLNTRLQLERDPGHKTLKSFV